jgi:dihydroneopterin triphosphate diphosphatase
MDENMHSQIPIRASVVCAYVFRYQPEGAEFLLLKRKSRYLFGLWGQVAGKIENGETVIQATLREIKEETGQIPKSLYSCDIVEIFYDIEYNCVQIVPVFAAIFEPDQDIIISNEHSEFKWVISSEAKELLIFPQQKSSIDLIDREFIQKEPPKELRILFPSYDFC